MPAPFPVLSGRDQQRLIVDLRQTAQAEESRVMLLLRLAEQRIEATICWLVPRLQITDLLLEADQ